VDNPEINHLSLCSGYGGIDLGLRRCIPSLRTVAYAEIEAFACELLLARMEGGQLDAAPIWTDLKQFPWGKFRGLVDILSGGYPCQPFSTAGKRLGGEDPRHLWPFISSGIRLLQPRVCFFENVDGHITQGLQRGEFSARLSAARLISGSESLSWPTATTTEAKSDTRQDRAARGKQVMLCHAVRQWPTPTANEDKDQNASWETLAKLDKGGRILRRIATLATGPAAPASRSSDGSRQESWATPSCMDTLPARSAQALTRAKEKGGCKNLREEVVQWATPEAKNQVGYQVGTDSTKWPRLGSQVSGKLNPRWVETLMGLPVGWTMPSCPSPVTIAPMSCVSSETESCQQLPSLPS
jgi:hypothetical protein